VAGKYYNVAKVGEIPEGEGRPFEIDGQFVAVILDEGVYYAIEDACPHQGAPLWDGVVEAKTVMCNWHGWRFSLEDGRYLDGGTCKVGTYPVRVEGDDVQVFV